MDASEVLFPPLDSPQQLSEYAATYYSDELDADYRISLKGNALRAGKPMLIVPFGQDQPDNARSCVRFGVGRTLSPARYTVSRVISELSELFNNSTYREQAAKVGQQVREENGTKTACDAIEQVLLR